MTHPLIVAHRGASARAPENTIAAFRRAIADGADGVEFDVRLAADGVPVVIHDADLRRVASQNVLVADLTAEQLRSIDVGSRFMPKARQHDRETAEFECVPMLSEVLRLLSGMQGPVYIELKCADTGYRPLAAAVCRVLSDLELPPRVIVKSFSLAAIREVKAILPYIRTAALFEPSLGVYIRGAKQMIEDAKSAGADEVSVHYSLATKKFCRLAAAAELSVAVWTVDDAKWLERCRKRGIGTLITNDPRRFKAA
ncbi:MAG: hypothetical protein HS105_02375 [Chloracidobacterium sp.]|nr:hypothetical protein [Chloracidobacterium sp.]MCO5333812.1 hypothetical protein [Pyrinomonadaceae bacterium]